MKRLLTSKKYGGINYYIIIHIFAWKILCHASKKTDIRKNLEAIFIALLKPSLNEQKNFERLILFRNGIT